MPDRYSVVGHFELGKRALLAVKCWDVPCTMSDVFVKGPTDQLTHLVVWSSGHVTNTSDIVHGTSQHLTASSLTHAVFRFRTISWGRHFESAKIAEFAPVAQLDRASDFESEGRGFDSLRAYFRIKKLGRLNSGLFHFGVLGCHWLPRGDHSPDAAACIFGGVREGSLFTTWRFEPGIQCP